MSSHTPSRKYFNALAQPSPNEARSGRLKTRARLSDNNLHTRTLKQKGKGERLLALFNCLKWPEMRAVAAELIARVHEGHASGRFRIPVVDFARVFAPGASPAELSKVATRGDMQFVADSDAGGAFTLGEGERALFDLRREGLVMRVPARMSGRYEVRPEAFRVTFNEGEELEGCKRLLLLVCNRVLEVEVSTRRVDVRLSVNMLDLCVEFD